MRKELPNRLRLGAFVLAASMSESLGLSKRVGAFTGVGVVVLLSTPFAPFSVYLATFWKDTWLLILLIWNLTLLFILRNQRRSSDSAAYLAQLFMLIVLQGLLLLVRHNAIVIYPVMAFALWHVLKRGIPRFYRFTFLLCPLLLYFGFVRFQYSALKVDHAHIEYVVYQVDLVSMIALKPSLLSEMPYMTEHLQGDWENSFIIGDSGYANIYLNDLLDNLLYLDPNSGPLLAREYKYAVTRFPFTWMSIKMIMFLDHLQPYKDRYLYNDYMEKNEFGLSLNTMLLPQRNAIFKAMNKISSHPLFRWISFVHLPWLVVNFAMVTIFILLSLRFLRFEAYFEIATIIMIPLAYYLSFLFAITSPAFRFMYPSTVVVQVMLWVTLVRFVASGWLPGLLVSESQRSGS